MRKIHSITIVFLLQDITYMYLKNTLIYNKQKKEEADLSTKQ